MAKRQPQNEVTKENIEKLASLSGERIDKHFQWLRNVVAMATGLISVLIALKAGKSTTACRSLGHGPRIRVGLTFVPIESAGRSRAVDRGRVPNVGGMGSVPMYGIRPRISLLLALSPKRSL